MSLDYKKLDKEFTILLDKFFEEHTKEEIEAILKEYDDLKFEGPTLKEYLKTLTKT